jgi:hypothetical protein
MFYCGHWIPGIPGLRPGLSSGGPSARLVPARMPRSGAGAFGPKQGGWKLALYLLLINLPFGIVTALVARVIIGEQP